eukprot:1137462-Pelagomonas_calceolata.AAC.2
MFDMSNKVQETPEKPCSTWADKSDLPKHSIKTASTLKNEAAHAKISKHRPSGSAAFHSRARHRAQMPPLHTCQQGYYALWAARALPGANGAQLIGQQENCVRPASDAEDRITMIKMHF